VITGLRQLADADKDRPAGGEDQDPLSRSRCGRLPIGAETLSEVPADGITAYRVRSHATWQGIEFRCQHRSSFYFSRGGARLFSLRFPKRALPSPPSLPHRQATEGVPLCRTS